MTTPPAPDTPDAPDALTVPTAQGPVTGVRQEGGTDAWYGVPFAAPPVGELRFRRPRPAVVRDRPLEASDWGPSPVQAPASAATGGIAGGAVSEDCLTLNIVRPSGTDGADGAAGTDGADGAAGAAGTDGAAGEDATTGLPVLVWIYGGAFTIGASRNYDGRHLAARGGAVVVTVNYRVGPWGFLDLSALSTPEHVFESNTGLHDQIAALAWVRDNIASFGGDPGNVTVFGESAGGSSVLSLMCMPEAAGLFHRVISQSPAVAGTPAPVHADLAARFGRTVAGEDAGAEETAQALTDLPADDLLAAAGRLVAEVAEEEPGRLIYGPCVDGESLPVAPLKAFLRGRQAPVPLVIGTNAQEGLLFLAGAQQSGSELLPVLPDTVRRALGESAAARGVLAAYPGFDDPAVSAQAGGDMVFWYPSTVFAAAHAAVAPTWSYRFDHVSTDPRFGALGATHGQEIPYVFGRTAAVLRSEGAADTDRDVAFSDALLGRWASFAHTGTPGPDWPGYRATDRQVRVFDGGAVDGDGTGAVVGAGDGVVESDPRSERREAWAALFG